MRWLLLKDLQILRRSPLQAVLLVAYPVLIAILVGFAISRGPEKVRVAFLNEVPANSRIDVGGQELPQANVQGRICKKVECVAVHSKQEAREKVQSGEVPRGPGPARGPDQQDQLALDPEPGDARSRSDRQRGGPGQGRSGQRPHHRAVGPGEPGDREANRQGRQPLPGADHQGWRAAAARLEHPHPRPQRQRQDPRSAGTGATARAAALGTRRSHPVRRPGGRKPRHRRAADRPPGRTDPGRQGRRRRRVAAAGNLRDRGRRDPHPGLRHRSARRRLARPGAGGERLRPAHPRTDLERGAADREGPCSASLSGWW